MKKQLTKNGNYGYEFKNSRGEIYSITENGKRVERIFGKGYQMTGVFIKNIPNHLKRVCFELNKNENKNNV